MLMDRRNATLWSQRNIFSGVCAYICSYVLVSMYTARVCHIHMCLGHLFGMFARQKLFIKIHLDFRLVERTDFLDIALQCNGS